MMFPVLLYILVKTMQTQTGEHFLPYYTMLSDKRKICLLHSPYDDDFARFYLDYVQCWLNFDNAVVNSAKSESEKRIFISFCEGEFDLSAYADEDEPYLILGKLEYIGSSCILPLRGKIKADEKRIHRLVQDLCDNCGSWLSHPSSGALL